MNSFVLLHQMRHGWVSMRKGPPWVRFQIFTWKIFLFPIAATCTHIGHPFGSLLSGFISDAIGRRKALIFIVAPAVLAFVGLAFAETFTIVCALFFFLSFIFGLKDAPATIYVSEVSEPSVCFLLLCSLWFSMWIEFINFFFQFSTGARYLIGHFGNCKTIGLCGDLFDGNISNVASMCYLHWNFTCHHCHCDMLCKFNQSFSPINPLIETLLYHIDSGDTKLVAIKRSSKRCAKIIAMAAWMVRTRIGSRWIYQTAKPHDAIDGMRFMCTTIDQMPPSEGQFFR